MRAHIRTRSGRLQTAGLRPLGVFAALLFAAGCDLPTDLPEFETRWVVPAEETSFGVDDLLPGDVRLSADATAFIVDFDAAAFSTTLGDLCAACLLANGLNVPKPPFAGSFESDVDFPDEVYQVTVVSGQATLEVENLFGFDPLRPGSGAEGTMTLRVTDSADGDVLAELVVDGSNTAFPTGSTLMRDLTLAPTEVNGGLLAMVELDSPLGDPVTIDASAPMNVVATPSNIRVAQVSADVSNESVTFDPVNLDVGDIDDEVVDIVVEGAFVLEVTNPFGIGAAFDLTIDGPTMNPIQRSDVIGPEPESTVRIEFTGAELRAFLGEPNVVLTGGANVSATAGIISLSPGQELILDADLDITLLLNGGD